MKRQIRKECLHVSHYNPYCIARSHSLLACLPAFVSRNHGKKRKGSETLLSLFNLHVNSGEREREREREEKERFHIHLMGCIVVSKYTAFATRKSGQHAEHCTSGVCWSTVQTVQGSMSNKIIC
jgi:hypothetical protein